MIRRILTEEGVPNELIHLAQAESAFQPTAISRKSAVGMWQFIAYTGKQYGLYRTPQVDLRLDPEKATRAAARHLRDLYQQLGDWYLAMAAYNCGPMCVERAVQRTGYADFWELRRRSALPRETRNYVPAILAMSIVSQNLSYYGIPQPEMDPALEYDSLRVGSDTGLPLIADAADVPVSVLRELNPSLLKGLAPAGTTVYVPRDRASVIHAAIETVPEPRRASWRLHRFASGDTLASIANKYSTAQKSILEANPGLTAGFFTSAGEGDTLLIPVTARPTVTSKAKSSRSYSSAKRPRSRTTTATKVASVSKRPSAKITR
jgi:membrane-bound lytic murein transglycosylase D